MHRLTVLCTVEEPEVVIKKIKEYFIEQDCEVVENEVKYKIEAKFPACDNMKVKVKIEEGEGDGYCISVEKNKGNKMNFMNVFNEIKKYLEEENMVI